MTYEPTANTVKFKDQLSLQQNTTSITYNRNMFNHSHFPSKNDIHKIKSNSNDFNTLI